MAATDYGPGVQIEVRVSVKSAKRAEGSDWLQPHAENIATQMRANLRPHWRTGQLEGSVRVVHRTDGRGYDIVAGDNDDIVYASFGEEGTDKMEAWPYAKPAVEAEQPAILATANNLFG